MTKRQLKPRRNIMTEAMSKVLLEKLTAADLTPEHLFELTKIDIESRTRLKIAQNNNQAANRRNQDSNQTSLAICKNITDLYGSISCTFTRYLQYKDDKQD